MKKVGIIGGMGPEATLDLYAKIIRSTPAHCDQDHVPVTIEICPQIPDRTEFIIGQGKSPFPLLLKASQNLAKGGVSALCMPCNTAHNFVDDLGRQIPLPFINMIDCVLTEIRESYPHIKRVGLLATSGTNDSGVYHRTFEENGLTILPMTAPFQKNVMDIIYKVKAGKVKEAAPDFQTRINDLERQGAEVIIAGCTELPLLIPYITVNVSIIDPTLLLARNIVRFSLGDKKLGCDLTNSVKK